MGCKDLNFWSCRIQSFKYQESTRRKFYFKNQEIHKGYNLFTWEYHEEGIWFLWQYILTVQSVSSVQCHYKKLKYIFKLKSRNRKKLTILLLRFFKPVKKVNRKINKIFKSEPSTLKYIKIVLPAVLPATCKQSNLHDYFS